MSNKRIAMFAAGIAAGTYTEDAVRQLVGGDEDQVNEILTLAASLGAGTVAGGVAAAATGAVVEVAEEVIDEVPVVREVYRATDEVAREVFDVIDDFNPFNDW